MSENRLAQTVISFYCLPTYFRLFFAAINVSFFLSLVMRILANVTLQVKTRKIRRSIKGNVTNKITCLESRVCAQVPFLRFLISLAHKTNAYISKLGGQYTRNGHEIYVLWPVLAILHAEISCF